MIVPTYETSTKELEIRCKELQKRIDKAIELCNKILEYNTEVFSFDDGENSDTGYMSPLAHRINNILKGEDKE